jgi:hypothetical protein
MASIINATTTNGVVASGDNSGSLQLATNNGTTAVTIDTSQNVTIAQAIKLSYSSNSNYANDAALSNYASGNGVYLNGNAAGWLRLNGDGTNASYIQITGASYSTPNQIQFFAGGSQRAVIDSSGNFYVGTTTGTIDTSNKGFAVGGGDGEVRFSRLVGGSSPVMNAYGSQGEARIMGDGDLENTNNRYTGISDIKFKQNIVDANSQWNDIKAIQVRNYELIKYPERKQIGCVAQELEQVCPHLVIEREDADGETYKSVAYSVLYMKAVKALQEAMERIETIEAKVEAQAAEIAALKGA